MTAATGASESRHLLTITPNFKTPMKAAIAQALRSEGRCSLTLARSSQGVITLQVQTHTFGRLDIELDNNGYTDLLFGLAAVPGTIARAIPARVPSDYQLGENPPPQVLPWMETARFLEDAPEGHVWRCPDCGVSATLGDNAAYHRDKNKHREPELIAKTSTPDAIDRLDAELSTTGKEEP